MGKLIFLVMSLIMLGITHTQPYVYEYTALFDAGDYNGGDGDYDGYGDDDGGEDVYGGGEGDYGGGEGDYDGYGDNDGSYYDYKEYKDYASDSGSVRLSCLTFLGVACMIVMLQ